MPYDGKILSRAIARFDEDKQRRTQQFRERQQRIPFFSVGGRTSEYWPQSVNMFA